MKQKDYYTVESNGVVKIMTQDFKSAYETRLLQMILGNDPKLKKNGKEIKGAQNDKIL